MRTQLCRAVAGTGAVCGRLPSVTVTVSVTPGHVQPAAPALFLKSDVWVFMSLVDSQKIESRSNKRFWDPHRIPGPCVYPVGPESGTRRGWGRIVTLSHGVVLGACLGLGTE